MYDPAGTPQGVATDLSLASDPSDDGSLTREHAEVARLRAVLQRTEEELARVRQDQGRLQTFLANSSDTIAVMDAEGILHYASPATHRMLGYAAGEFLGK